MKSALALLFAVANVQAVEQKSADIHMFDFDNAKMLWKNDFGAYEKVRRRDDDSNDCKLAESDNYYGAQQCKYSWECRGARTCERGGWCSGYDGCEGTPLPMQSPGLMADH